MRRAGWKPALRKVPGPQTPFLACAVAPDCGRPGYKRQKHGPTFKMRRWGTRKIKGENPQVSAFAYNASADDLSYKRQKHGPTPENEGWGTRESTDPPSKTRRWGTRKSK